ncbi:granzyme G-like isoform X2 [Mastomys coucha]|uniref:granzyme G-like isoform X2 n=1 Tax=Mastomys coucha TaxID=35658 RepID=UPI0012625246|nr:granzyme G-like isoform X2 [Mastomys coucha]
MPPVLILLTLLLPLGVGAEEIIGGHEVKPHSRPYMAFIETPKVDKNITYYCGGFLVQDYFVLTAAHCKTNSMTKVTLGAHNRLAQEKTQQIIPVEKVIPHPDFNKADLTNDIMLFKLKSKAKRTKAVRPLNLPGTNDQVKPGDVCSVAGWGKTSINANEVSALLREAKLMIQEDQKCKKLFKEDYSKTTQICAGDPKKIQDAYKGDSGGPLVCNNKAYGIVSYGPKRTISSGVFTKVVHFLPWISRNMKLL